MGRRLFVLVDVTGYPVEAAGPAPFDGRTRADAEREARATVGEFRAGWRVVSFTLRLDAALRRMAEGMGLEPPGRR